MTDRPRQRRKQKSKQKTPPDVLAWLDRVDVADLLKISVNTITGLERRGLLHPRRVIRADRRGAKRLTYIYDPKEVATVPRHTRHTNARDPGETAARCFELLELGKPLYQIVIELRETPDTIRELHEKWSNMGGADLVISPAAWERLGKLVGPFVSVSELVERVTALARDKENDEDARRRATT